MAAERRKETWRPVRLTVGVTAHRDILNSERPGIERIVGEFFDALSRRFPDTPLQALCPLAEGGERIFARAAVARGIPLVVPLPLPREYYVKDFPDAASREEFDLLCRDATVFELPLRSGVTREQVARPGELRDHEYAQLGVFVASHSQILVAIWDGKHSGGLGGTAQIVRYRLYNVYPSLTAARPIGQEVLADDENDLAYHIVCSRSGDGESPASPLEPLGTSWLTGDPESQSTREMPEKYARIFTMTAKFNRDGRRWHGAANAAVGGLFGAAGNMEWPAGIRHIDRMFTVADGLANRFQRRLNFALRSTYTLAVLMGTAFVGYSTIPDQQPLLYAFLGLFALGFCLYEIARRGDWHRKYLDYRVLAEGLRVQFFRAIAGVGNAGDGRFAYENFLQMQDAELGWIRHVMRDVELQASPPTDTGEAGLNFALNHWVGGASDSGQLGYYANEARQRYRLHRLTEGVGALCLWSGIAIAVVLAVLARELDSVVRTVMLVLLGLLPLIAAIRGAYSYKRADKELIKQYRFMANIFRNARRRLNAASDAEEKREVLRVLGNAALDEHAEWILMHRERPLERSKL